MKNYKWDAKDYAANSSFQSKLADELIAKFNLRGNENVLDIGCGDGKITVKIASIVPDGKVVGIDSSEKMISFAKNTFPPSNYKNLSFEIMDAGAIQFNNQFDFVFSNAALHWIKDHRPVLKGIFQSLKPAGKILLQMGGKGNVSSIVETITPLSVRPEWKNYFDGFEFPYGFYSDEEYKIWMQETGFQINRVEMLPKDMSYENKEGLAVWIRTTWLPYLNRIPDEKREEFIAEIVDMYCSKYPIGNDGKIHVDMVRLEVDAFKPNK